MAPLPEGSTGFFPGGDHAARPHPATPSCCLPGVSWWGQSQGGVEARGRQTERTAGAGGKMHLWSRVFLPGPTCCCFFFFDKSLLGHERAQAALWLSFPVQGLIHPALGAAGSAFGAQPRPPPGSDQPCYLLNSKGEVGRGVQSRCPCAHIPGKEGD